MIDQSNNSNTLWETWFGNSYNAVGSRNHIMFGSQSTYYYTVLAGIKQHHNSIGYQNIIIKPYIDIRNNKQQLLDHITASIYTIRGQITVSWQLHTPKLCSQVRQNDALTLQCIANIGTIDMIEYASYGTTDGSCNHYSHSNCDSKYSLDIVRRTCIGYSNCTLIASNNFFNHRDPCPNIIKTLTIQATGSCYVPRLTIQFTLPIGNISTIYIPLLDTNINNVLLINNKNNNQQIIWSYKNNNKYKYNNNNNGIYNSILQDNNIILTVNSGYYDLILAVPSNTYNSSSNNQLYSNNINIINDQYSNNNQQQQQQQYVAIE